jgi:hypothetical protein
MTSRLPKNGFAAHCRRARPCRATGAAERPRAPSLDTRSAGRVQAISRQAAILHRAARAAADRTQRCAAHLHLMGDAFSTGDLP